MILFIKLIYLILDIIIDLFVKFLYLHITKYLIHDNNNILIYTYYIITHSIKLNNNNTD